MLSRYPVRPDFFIDLKGALIMEELIKTLFIANFIGFGAGVIIGISSVIIKWLLDFTKKIMF